MLNAGPVSAPGSVVPPLAFWQMSHTVQRDHKKSALVSAVLLTVERTLPEFTATATGGACLLKGFLLARMNVMLAQCV